MRVLVLSSVFPNASRPTYGLFVRERVRHLAERCEVQVAAPVLWFPFNRLWRGFEGVAPAVERDGLLTVCHPRVLCLPGVGKCLDGILYFLSLLPFIARLRRRFPFDLIDVHFTYPDGVAGALLGRAFGCPVVLTVRGSHDVRHAGYRLRRVQIRFAMRAADRVIAVSRSLARFAAALGARQDRIRVVPNAVDPDRFRVMDQPAARTALGLPVDCRILLSVGTLIEGKGHHRILDLLPGLLAERRDLLYVAVGTSPDRAYRRHLEDVIAGRRLGEHVRLVGPRPHEEIPRWMAAADVFCLATQSEGWCNAITEALACGLPVVATDVGGNAEIVEQGVDGFLAPFWDADAFRRGLVTALDRAWDRAAISGRARRRGWRHTAETLVREFNDVLSTESGLGLPSRGGMR